MIGLLVLLKDHHGEDDLARLADDLDLEIDEILPSSDWAAALGLVQVRQGRMTFTDVGRKFVASGIRERKTLLREQLKRTTLYSTLLRALEAAPNSQLSEEDVNRLIAFTSAPSDDQELNIINWGRYAELFRYSPETHLISLVRHRPAKGSGPADGRVPPTAESPGASADVPAPPNSEPVSPMSRTALALS